jgi:NADH-quinone oxidoreductase subunit C
VSGAATDGATGASALDQRLRSVLGADVRLLPQRDGMPTIEVAAPRLRETARALRDRCGFGQLTLVTAIDHYPRVPRFELVLQLCAIPSAERVRVVSPLEGDEPTAPSVLELWPGAGFMERECWDMYGIRFEGHEDLKRLLMPDGYGHHPLRKDFPHQGIQPDRLYREWDENRRREQR